MNWKSWKINCVLLWTKGLFSLICHHSVLRKGRIWAWSEDLKWLLGCIDIIEELSRFLPPMTHFMKVQPYRQHLVLSRTNQKLSPKYGEPFPIKRCICKVAYQVTRRCKNSQCLPYDSIEDCIEEKMIIWGNDIHIECRRKFFPLRKESISCRKRKNRLQVLTQWVVGWSADHATWEHCCEIWNW